MTRDAGGGRGAGAAGFERWRTMRPSDVLAELAETDPLEIGPRTVARVRERALLLDFDRTADRAFARVAWAAPAYRGEPPLERWLRECIDRAIEDMLEEDVTEEFEGALPENPAEPRLIWLRDAFGLEPALARRACVRFNELPETTRKLFVLTTLEDRPEEALEACPGGPSELERHLFEAVQALAAGVDPREFDGGGAR